MDAEVRPAAFTSTVDRFQNCSRLQSMTVETSTTEADEAAHDEMRSSSPAVPPVPGRLQPLLQMCCPRTICQLQHYSRTTSATQPQFDLCNSAPPSLHRAVPAEDSFNTSAPILLNMLKQDSQGDELYQGEATMGGRKRKLCKLWTQEQILAMLDLYQEKWVSLGGASFKWKHWAMIAEDLNMKYETNFSDAQCKNKWDALKKTYLKEKARTLIEASRWEFYDRFNEVLVTISKLKGLGGDNSKEFECNMHHLMGEDEDQQDGFTSNVPSVEHDDANNGTHEALNIRATSPSGYVRGEDANPMAALKDPLRMQRKRKKRKSSLGVALERGMAHFAEVMKEIELRRIEADNKRWEKMLEMQMRIVEIFARRPG